jgi:hypothetical protein
MFQISVERWGDLPPGYTCRNGRLRGKEGQRAQPRRVSRHRVRPGWKVRRSWGEDIGFVNAHGAAVGPYDMLYLTNDFGAAVRKCSPQAEVVLTIGTLGKPAPRFSGDPCNRCTHTARWPRGDI